MDPALAAVAIVFIIAILILGITMISGSKSEKSDSVANSYAAKSYPTQYGGGGCGVN